MLPHVKDRHGDIESVAHKIHRHPHLEEILKKHPRIYLMHVVFLRQHGDQFIAQHKSDDHARYRHDDRIRQVPDQAENVAIPALRCLSHLRGNLPCLLVHAREHGCKV